MVDLLIKNGLVVTMDENRRVLKGASVAIEDGRIKAVGQSKNKGRPEEVIDARGKIVMPGLICAHTHMYGALLRGAPLKIDPPTDLLQVLQRVWWPLEEVMTKHDANASALISCLESIKTGTTFLADTYSGPESITGVLDQTASAIQESGLRGLVSFEATERRTHAQGAKGMRENLRFIKKTKKKGRGRVQGMISISASFTVSDELLSYGRKIASQNKVPLTIHVSEGAVDPYHNLENYGKRTVERLNEVGFLAPDTVLSHCVHVNDEELAIIKKSGAKVAHNPMSNMLNGVGVAPVPKMRALDIPVGLGNDGYVLDGFANIRAAFLLHKLALGDPRAMSAMEALEMATVRGAELYGLENKLGSIEEGKLGDVIIVNPSRIPTLLRPESAVDHIVNTVNGDDVETVVVGGRMVMQDRKVLTLDEREVVRASRKSAEKIWQKMGAIRR